MAEDVRQDELFAQYWEALAEDPAAPPPPDLAPAAARHARQMQPPDPRAEFVAHLEQRLRALPAPAAPDRDETPLLRSGLPVRIVRRPSRQVAPLFAMMAMLLVLVVGAALLAGMLAGRSRQLTEGTGPPNDITQGLTDAHDILQRAKDSLNPSAVKSYIVTETLRSPQLHTLKTWYQAPSLWRTETITTTAQPTAAKPNLPFAVEVIDGTNYWEYDPISKILMVNSIQAAPHSLNEPPHPGNGLVSSSGQEIETAIQCYTPSLQGSKSVADRQTYVIALTGWHCYGATQVFPSDEVIWIDSETFLVLGRASYGNRQTHPQDEVTGIQYNVAIDPTTFSFTPPAEATVLDYRPQPAPSASEFQNEIATLAKQASYPIFLPQYLPDGLVPLHLPPTAASATWLAINYAPPATASTPSADTSGMDPNGGIRVYQSQPSYQALVNMLTDTTLKPTQVGGEPAWVRSAALSGGQMMAIGSAVTFFHQGTMVSISSRSYSSDELVKVAASLAAVPGGHAPLSNPTLTGLLRQDAGFAVLLPTHIPAGLTAEPPSLGGKVEIRYHNSDGEVALLLSSSKITTPTPTQMGDPYTSSGLPLTLPNGLTAHFETAECNHGQASLYWQQDGEFVTLVSVPTHKESAGFSKEEMVKIAASLSKTADLGRVEPAPANRQPNLPFPEATALTCPTPALPLPEAQPTGIP